MPYYPGYANNDWVESNPFADPGHLFSGSVPRYGTMHVGYYPTTYTHPNPNIPGGPTTVWDNDTTYFYWHPKRPDLGTLIVPNGFDGEGFPDDTPPFILYPDGRIQPNAGIYSVPTTRKSPTRGARSPSYGALYFTGGPTIPTPAPQQNHLGMSQIQDNYATAWDYLVGNMPR